MAISANEPMMQMLTKPFIFALPQGISRQPAHYQNPPQRCSRARHAHVRSGLKAEVGQGERSVGLYLKPTALHLLVVGGRTASPLVQ
jgi:hypothetical protein